MKSTTLVIMAAGMGSRYGGLKQIDPVDEDGHIIIDFSIYDAKRAGFEKVIFIIKKENEEDRERTEQSFMVDKQEIIDNGYDLSINKYKKIEYVPVEYPPTEEILAEIEELNEEITKETAELRALLRK